MLLHTQSRTNRSTKPTTGVRKAAAAHSRARLVAPVEALLIALAGLEAVRVDVCFQTRVSVACAKGYLGPGKPRGLGNAVFGCARNIKHCYLRPFDAMDVSIRFF